MGGRPAAGRAENVRVALPLEDRARLIIGLLALVIVVDCFALAADLEWNSVIERLQTGQRVTYAEAESVDDHQGTVGVIQLVLWVLTAIGFLLWYSRAYRNVIALGLRQPRYGTRWAVIGWFVPFVNLVLPKHVVNDTWRGSDPGMVYGDVAYGKRPVHGVVHLWWGFFLVSGVLANWAQNPDPYRPFSDQAKFFIAAGLTNIIAAGLAIAVVRMITDRAELRRYRLDRQAAERGVTPVGAAPFPTSP